MTQELSFSKTIKQLYFNVDVKNASPDSVINEFAKLATEHKASTGMSSLSANLDMQMDGNVKKIFHFFKFINSPLPNFVVDKGYIKLSLGVAGTTKKILDIEWCFEFLKKADELFVVAMPCREMPLEWKIGAKRFSTQPAAIPVDLGFRILCLV